MMPFGCGCCKTCTVHSDSFNRPSEKIKGPDSTGKWIGTPTFEGHPDEYYAWRTSSGSTPYVTCIDNYGNIVGTVGAYRLTSTVKAPRHLAVECKMAPGAIGAKLSINFQNITDGTSGEGNRYKLQITASDRTYVDDGDDTACGLAEFWDVLDLTAPVLLLSIPIPGLCATGGNVKWHTVKLCYNPDTQVLTGFVRTLFNKDYWLHVKNVVTPPDPIENSGVWLEVNDFGDYGAQPFGVSRFTDFKMAQSMNTPEGDNYSDYAQHGIADDEVKDCPCCRDGCGETEINWAGQAYGEYAGVEGPPVDDCRWQHLTGSITQDGFGTATVRGLHIFRSSWSGLDDDCLPDDSVYVSTSVSTLVPGGSAVIRLLHQGSAIAGEVQYYDCRLSFGSSFDSGDGVIEIRDSLGAVLATDTIEGAFPNGQAAMGMAACFDGNSIAFNAGNKQIEADATNTGGQFIGIAGTMSGTGMDFGNINISHNIFSQDCVDCWGGSGPGGPGGPPGTQPYPPYKPPGPTIPNGGDPESCETPDGPRQICIGGITPQAIKAKLSFTCTHAPSPPGFPPKDFTCALLIEAWLRSTIVLKIDPLTIGASTARVPFCPFIPGYDPNHFFCMAQWAASIAVCPEDVGGQTNFLVATLNAGLFRSRVMATGQLEYRMAVGLRFAPSLGGLSMSSYSGMSAVLSNVKMNCLDGLASSVELKCESHGEERVSPCDESDADDLKFIAKVSNI